MQSIQHQQLSLERQQSESSLKLLKECLDFVNKQIEQKKSQLSTIHADLLGLLEEQIKLSSKLLFEEMKLKECDELIKVVQSRESANPVETASTLINKSPDRHDDTRSMASMNVSRQTFLEGAVKEESNFHDVISRLMSETQESNTVFTVDRTENSSEARKNIDSSWQRNEILKSLQDFASGSLPQVTNTPESKRKTYQPIQPPEEPEEHRKRRRERSPSSRHVYCTHFNIAHGVNFISFRANS